MRSQVERAGAAEQGMARVAVLLSGRLLLEASTLRLAVAAARHEDLHSSGPAEASATPATHPALGPSGASGVRDVPS